MAQNFNTLIEYVCRFLIAKPINSVAKTKQKILAQLILTNTRYITTTVPDLKDLLTEIVTLHSQHIFQSGDAIVDSINKTKFESLSFIFKDPGDISGSELDSIMKQFRNRIIAAKILEETQEIQKKLDDLENKPSYDQIVKDYEEIITNAYISLVDSKVDTEEINLLDISNESNNSLQNLIELAKDQGAIPTNYKILNSYLHSGGFESGRIYVFGGKPGLGKSSMLLNLLVQNSLMPKKQLGVSDKSESAFVYITLENDIVETSERIIRIITGKDLDLKQMSSKERDFILTNLKLENNMLIKYMIPYDTTTSDIFIYLSKIAEQYKILGVYVDHLSLMVSKEKTLERRHDLGRATSELRTAAKKFACPVIVAAQLNTGGYKGIPTIANLDESRQIAQNADFVALLFEQEIDVNTVSTQVNMLVPDIKYIGLNIDKNRNGRSGIIYYTFNGSVFRFSETNLRPFDFNQPNRIC
ncbi:MAG: DnaB-like helicase C-terminal domain-containing protein [Conexivisphaerales archaeon]